MRKRYLVLLSLCLLAIGSVLYYVALHDVSTKRTSTPTTDKSAPCLAGQGTSKAVKGNCAPDFTLQTLNGNKLSLYNDQHKPTLLVFWASWCPPCKKQMASLSKAYPNYKDKINFLLVNVTSEDKEADVRKYVSDNKYDMPFVLDPTGGVSTKLYRVQGFPTNYVISSRGEILDVIPGSMTQVQIDTLLNQVAGR